MPATDTTLASVMHGKLAEMLEGSFRKQMSPKGKLGLPPLLDARRLEYGIPDSVFKRRSAFDFCLIWQIPDFIKERQEGKVILLDDTVARKREEAPLGILCSAGLAALDNLRSNGMDLGHKVGFLRLAPMRRVVAVVDNHEFFGIVVRDGDVESSEDTETAIRKGECKVELREFTQKDGTVKEKHVFVDKAGKQWMPQIPWTSDDY